MLIVAAPCIKKLTTVSIIQKHFYFLEIIEKLKNDKGDMKQLGDRLTTRHHEMHERKL